MAFKELPLNNRLLEQFDTEPISDVETYNPNVQAMEFGDYETTEVLNGVEVSLGQYYTRPDSRLTFTFETPTSYEGTGYTGNIEFTIKKANSTSIVSLSGEYADVLASLGGQYFTVDLSTHDISVGDVLVVELNYEVSVQLENDTWEDMVPMFGIELNVVDESAGEVGKIVYAPYVARITEVNGNTIKVNQNWKDFKNKIPNEIEGSEFEAQPDQIFNDWSIGYRTNDKRDLYTYLHFGGDQMKLVTNIKTDNINFPKLPYSAVFKLYEPLPDDIEEKDRVHVVREV